MASVAFSSDSVEVISRRLDSLTCRTTGVGLELAEYYEIGRCKDFILVNDFKKVLVVKTSDWCYYCIIFYSIRWPCNFQTTYCVTPLK